MKTSENQRSSDIFRGYQKRPVAWNALTEYFFLWVFEFHVVTLQNYLMHIWINHIMWFYNKNENEKDHNEKGLDMDTYILNLKGISL